MAKAAPFSFAGRDLIARLRRKPMSADARTLPCGKVVSLAGVRCRSPGVRPLKTHRGSSAAAHHWEQPGHS